MPDEHNVRYACAPPPGRNDEPEVIYQPVERELK